MKAADGRTLVPTTCKVCGYEFDAASDPFGQQRPCPGDITLCMKCGEIYVFDDDMRPIEPTITYLSSIEAEVMREIDRVQMAIRKSRVKD